MFRTERDRARREGTRREGARPSTSVAEAERSRFSPGPLAGDEPLFGHAIDPDADEALLDDAIVAAEEEGASGDGEDQAPALSPATLAEQRGMGVLRLVWDADGEVIETMGSWRPLEVAPDAQPLPSGSQVRFAGTLYLDANRSVPIDTAVVISGGGTYTDVNGNDVTLVRFKAPTLVADPRFSLRR